MDGATLIPSQEVISRQIEVLDCEHTVVGLAVGAHGIGLGLGEITNQCGACRVEVPAHMEEPECPGSALHPSPLTHQSELQICRLELGTICVPCLERFKRRRAA